MNRIKLVCDLLISYLKQNGVRHIVISSGTRAIPFIKAIENDSHFTCYSVIDERNAAFYALGLSQQLQEPVGLTCTSGTAASNYLSGITEAFFAHTPVVAITADRSMQVLHQLETQKVDQPAIFSPVTQKSICLPVIKDRDDFWYAKRLLDEAFLAMRQRGEGPIHINLPIEGTTNDITLDQADDNKNIFHQLEYFSRSHPERWDRAFNEIGKYRRILVVIGQNINIDPATTAAITEFCHRFRIPVLGDNLSNFRCDEMIFAQAPIKAMNADTFAVMLPELVISIGNNFQERIKDLFKAHRGKFSHWLVDEGGIVRDWTRSLSALFECDVRYFFETFNHNANPDTDGSYLDNWREIANAAKLPEKMPWSNFYLAGEFAKRIPERSILHLAILNSTRLTQFYQLPASVKVSCNASSFGIDGCLPTLLGQSAAAPQKLAFILLGDLSFFYAMNALSIKGISKNVRVLLSNNGGGAEFHIYPHLQKNDKIDLHIAAAHGYTAREWAESAGFRYLSARDKEELSTAMTEFIAAGSDRPVLLEVFTDLHFDGEYCLDVYRHLESEVNPVIERIKASLTEPDAHAANKKRGGVKHYKSYSYTSTSHKFALSGLSKALRSQRHRNTETSHASRRTTSRLKTHRRNLIDHTGSFLNFQSI